MTDELLHRLAECHRPVSKRYPAAIDMPPGWTQQHCPCCDGSVWWVKAPGDPPRECAFWLEYCARVEAA